MKRLTLLSALVFTQLCIAQQVPFVMTRVGDAFRGHIQQVRSEIVQVQMKDGVTIEGSRVVTQIVNYSEDGRRRETESYSAGSLRRKVVETYLPGGQLENRSIYDGDGTLISKTGYEYNSAGLPTVQTESSADGSTKETKTNQWSESGNLVAFSKSLASGTTNETSVNSNNYSTKTSGEPKRSVWTTTKSDGSKTENIFEVDASGTHHDQMVNYGPDGTLTGRRVSIVDAGVTRLEALEYDASGNITKHTLETREYDSHHNLNKITNFRWNAERKEFQPFVITYHTIAYYG